MECKKIRPVAEHFQISWRAVRKYIQTPETEITALDKPPKYQEKESKMSPWVNIIFKMMQAGESYQNIYFYIFLQPDFKESSNLLAEYIYLIAKNNFPYRSPFRWKNLKVEVFPPDVVYFQRHEVLKYLLTCNPKAKKDEKLGKYIEIIKEKYPIAAYVETVFKEFHGIIMGENPDELDMFLEKYSESNIAKFCNGIKKDIAPVKNAISHPESSGFVEGNNNKFKLLKRIVYGRSGLVNLQKKCNLAFMPKDENFKLSSLL